MPDTGDRETVVHKPSLWDDAELLAAKLKTEEGQIEVLTEMVGEHPPRSFVICGVAPALDDAGVVAYGTVLPDRVVIYEPNREQTTRHSSVQRAVTFHTNFVTNLRVVWPEGRPVPPQPAD